MVKPIKIVTTSCADLILTTNYNPTKCACGTHFENDIKGNTITTSCWFQESEE